MARRRAARASRGSRRAAGSARRRSGRSGSRRSSASCRARSALGADRAAARRDAAGLRPAAAQRLHRSSRSRSSSSIDDFHTVQSVEIAATFDELLRAAPASLRLVLSTRHDPMLPLHLLRASGELTELRARDLAFTPERGARAPRRPRASRSSRSRSRRCSPAPRAGRPDCGCSCSRTGSGPRGLDGARVARASTSAPPPSTCSRRCCGASRRTSATSCSRPSIAERFTPDLADAMTGRTDSAHIAERLVADNLFIDRVETQPPWYRYHNLFAELLRAELRHTRTRLDPGAARARRAVALRAGRADGSRAARARRGRPRPADDVPRRRLVRADRADGHRVPQRRARADLRGRRRLLGAAVGGSRERRLHQRPDAQRRRGGSRARRSFGRRRRRRRCRRC